MCEQLQIIKLDATESTNQYLKDVLQDKSLDDFTIVVTQNQQKGRGQMGSAWQSEPGKNLTFSFLKKFDALHVTQQFNLNICVSLAICAILERLQIPNLKVKWPNDIMSGSFKICGILIENMLKGHYLSYSVIGIGLNVNQTSFQNLNKAASLSSITKKTFDLDMILRDIMMELKQQFSGIEKRTVAQMLPAYERLLFRKDKISTFKDSKGVQFLGFIRGVSKEGKLILEIEEHQKKEFDLKEITLLY